MSMRVWPKRCRALFGSTAVIVIVGACLLAARRGWSPVRQDRLVVLYGYSTLDDPLREGILPAFAEAWLREHGERVEFAATFAGSGSVVDLILRKVPAEVAIVTSELDARRIPGPFRSWTALPHGGVLARSPLVIVVRPGNPRDIRGFEDLARPGIELLHADPATSGAAALTVLAVHGREPAGSEVALERLRATWKNVTELLPSAREVRRRFEQGVGDAFVTYEQDVVATPSKPAVDGEVVRPRGTIEAEPLVVKVEANLDRRQREVVDALVAFLWTREAQAILVEHGFRSVLPELEAPRAELERFAEARTLSAWGDWKTCRDVMNVWREQILPHVRR